MILKRIIFCPVQSYALWTATFALWLLRLYRRHAKTHEDLKGLTENSRIESPPQDLPPLHQRPLLEQLTYFAPVVLALFVAPIAHAVYALPIDQALPLSLGALVGAHLLLRLFSDA